MPHLQSLSIRLRGHRTDKSTTTTSSSSSHTFKHFFFGRERKPDSTDKSEKTRKSTDKMGNAPSDMNSRTSSPRQRLAQLARSATDAASVRSASAMPGAEPPTPVPSTPSPSPPLEPWRSPSPETEVRVQGYDVQDVPHVLNPTPAEESDIGTGLMPLGGPFQAEESTAEVKPQESHDAQEQDTGVYQDAEAQPEPDSVKTPRAAVMSEESLAPVTEEEPEHASPPGLEHHTPHHEPEASDATAVSSGSGAGAPAGGEWAPGTYVLLNARSGTAVDMSGMDNKTLIGYPMHGGPNQQVRIIASH